MCSRQTILSSVIFLETRLRMAYNSKSWKILPTDSLNLFMVANTYLGAFAIATLEIEDALNACCWPFDGQDCANVLQIGASGETELWDWMKPKYHLAKYGKSKQGTFKRINCISQGA